MGKAAKLIQEAQRGPERLPRAVVKELEKIIEYNDSAPHRKRVTWAKVVEMLSEDFGISTTPNTLDRWVREIFGRTFGGN